MDCVVTAGTTKLFLSGLSEGCVMEADTAGPLTYGLFVDSPDTKSQMASHIQNGVSFRAAFKAMGKQVRVEARRQRELEEGRPPEVLLESFSRAVEAQVASCARASEACPDFSCQCCESTVVRRPRGSVRLCVGGLPTARSVSMATGAL